jgi:vacuolar-type H+-ATPase subunit I/STV1
MMKKYRVLVVQSCQLSGMDQPPARPTPAEAEQFARATRDLPEIGQLTPEDAADLLEAITGRPMDYGETQQAIAALDRRIVRLQHDRASLQSQLDKCTDEADTQTYLNAIRHTESSIASLDRQREFYLAQAKQQN